MICYFIWCPIFWCCYYKYNIIRDIIVLWLLNKTDKFSDDDFCNCFSKLSLNFSRIELGENVVLLKPLYDLDEIIGLVGVCGSNGISASIVVAKCNAIG